MILPQWNTHLHKLSICQQRMKHSNRFSIFAIQSEWWHLARYGHRAHKKLFSGCWLQLKMHKYIDNIFKKKNVVLNFDEQITLIIDKRMCTLLLLLYERREQTESSGWSLIDVMDKKKTRNPLTFASTFNLANRLHVWVSQIKTANIGWKPTEETGKNKK